MAATRLTWVAALVAASSAFVSTARADVVVLEPLTGTAVQERLDDVSDALGAAIRQAGHQLINAPLSVGGLPPPIPQTQAELEAVAQANHAQWVVTATVAPMPGQYRLTIRASFSPAHRVEDLEVNVLESEEAERLRDVARCLLRPEGLGDDAIRLSEDPDAARRAREQAAAAARARAEAEARAQGDVEARARAEREEAQRRAAADREATLRAARERQAWADRPRYGVREPGWIALAGLGVKSLLAHQESRSGGFTGSLDLRIGRAIPSVPGLELRGALDLWFGDVSAVTISTGAIYLVSPFTYPLFVGGGGDVGIFQGLSGARSTGILVRASPYVAWRPSPNFYVEGALPELSIVSSSGGAVTIGASVRAGWRFE